MNEGAKFVMVGQVGGRKNCGNATTIEMRIWGKRFTNRNLHLSI